MTVEDVSLLDVEPLQEIYSQFQDSSISCDTPIMIVPPEKSVQLSNTFDCVTQDFLATMNNLTPEISGDWAVLLSADDVENYMMFLTNRPGWDNKISNFVKDKDVIIAPYRISGDIPIFDSERVRRISHLRWSKSKRNPGFRVEPASTYNDLSAYWDKGFFDPKELGISVDCSNIITHYQKCFSAYKRHVGNQ